MAENETINQILKQIVMKATKDHLETPLSLYLPKTNTQKDIAEKTGINITTLGRYLNPREEGSCPDLVEAMEILRVVQKREAIFEFTRRSTCHAAKFIRDCYGKYIEANQIEAEMLDVSEVAPLSGDVLKIMNEHQHRFDKKMIRLTMVLILGVALFGYYNDYRTDQRMQQLTKDINVLIKEIENENQNKSKN
ncbi:MAG: hypothetical protein HYV97_02800 [Bdellovibrio sp.]|nr:hypothetical protein [Bdellovibrio sp.]